MPETTEKELTRIRNSRLPSKRAIDRTHGSVGKLVERTTKSAAEAREYNEKLGTDHQETFYLGAMNLIAEKIYLLARNKHSDVEELRMYLDLFLRHRDQNIKEKKTALMMRHMELLEAKRKALEDAVKSGLSDTMIGERVRKILGVEKPATNGNGNHLQLENGFAA
jgi:hypothetical protein